MVRDDRGDKVDVPGTVPGEEREPRDPDRERPERDAPPEPAPTDPPPPTWPQTPL